MGERIRVLREYRGMSKTALGKAIGKEGRYIGMIKAGKRRGTAATLKAIAQALKVDLEMIV